MRFIFQLGNFPAEREFERDTTLRERNSPGSGKITARTSERPLSVLCSSLITVLLGEKDSDGSLVARRRVLDIPIVYRRYIKLSTVYRRYVLCLAWSPKLTGHNVCYAIQFK